MALISCYECSAEISTAAAACPHCGAPKNPAPSISIQKGKLSPLKIVAITLIAILVVVAGYISESRNYNSNESTKEIQPISEIKDEPKALLPSKPEPAAKPFHYYSLYENGQYGYEAALTEEDKNVGTVTKPLTMVKYLGDSNGVFKVEVNGAQTQALISCSAPCDFVRVRTGVQGMIVSDERMRNTAGSLISAIMLDATTGKLEPYVVARPSTAPPIVVTPDSFANPSDSHAPYSDTAPDESPTS